MIRKTVNARMEAARKAQKDGTYTRCPRCGRDTMRLGEHIHSNALSRTADIMVCDDCGQSEAKLAFMGVPLANYLWDCAKPNRPASDFKDRPAEEVSKAIETEQLKDLCELFRMSSEGADFGDVQLTAFESLPGLEKIWLEPFEARYATADGHVCVRFRWKDEDMEYTIGIVHDVE